MAISSGNNNISGINVGSQSISEAYIGSTKIWPSELPFMYGTLKYLGYDDEYLYEDFDDLTAENWPSYAYILVFNPSDGSILTYFDVSSYINDYTPEDEYVSITHPLNASQRATIAGCYATAICSKTPYPYSGYNRIEHFDVIPLDPLAEAKIYYYNVYNQGDSSLDYWFSSCDTTNVYPNQKFTLMNIPDYNVATTQGAKSILNFSKASKINTVYGSKVHFNNMGAGNIYITRVQSYYSPVFRLVDAVDSWGTWLDNFNIYSNYYSVNRGAYFTTMPEQGYTTSDTPVMGAWDDGVILKNTSFSNNTITALANCRPTANNLVSGQSYAFRVISTGRNLALEYNYIVKSGSSYSSYRSFDRLCGSFFTFQAS